MKSLSVILDGNDKLLRSLVMGQRLSIQLKVSMLVAVIVEDSVEVAEFRDVLLKLLDVESLSFTLEEFSRDREGEMIVDMISRDEEMLCLEVGEEAVRSGVYVNNVVKDILCWVGKPMVLCGPSYDADAHRWIDVLMVYVGSEGLSGAVLTNAVSLAKKLNARLQIIKAVDYVARGGVRAEREGESMGSDCLYDMAKRLEREHNMEVDWEVLYGNPVDSVVGYLQESRNIMLVMDRCGWDDRLQTNEENFAQEVISQARCPVVFMRKPEVF